MDSRNDGGRLSAANETSVDRVRELNDDLRVRGRGGRICLSRGIAELGHDSIRELRGAIAAFDDFSSNNDPYGEHDSGALRFHGERILWKIDYYDASTSFTSPDPANPNVTARVLTIMLGREY